MPVLHALYKLFCALFQDYFLCIHENFVYYITFVEHRTVVCFQSLNLQEVIIGLCSQITTVFITIKSFTWGPFY